MPRKRKMLLSLVSLTLLPLAILLANGCIASSAHTKRGDVVLMQLAQEVERHQRVDHSSASTSAAYIKQKAERHAEQDSSIISDIPTSSIPFEALGGMGAVLAAGFGLWQRSQTQRAIRIAKEAAELPPEEAKKVLSTHRIV